MNISAISFGNNAPLYDEQLQRLFTKQRAQQTSYSTYRQSAARAGYSAQSVSHIPGLESEYLKDINPKPKKKANGGLRKIMSYILAATVGAGAVQARYMINKPDNTQPVQEAKHMTCIVSGSNINAIQLAQCYDSDARAIILFNDLLRNDPAAVRELYIPQLYSPIDSKIEEIQSKLKNTDHLEPTEASFLQGQLMELQARKQMQQDIATTFTDGKNVYFLIKILEFSNNPDVSQYGSQIPLEVFFKLFDISKNLLEESDNSPCEIPNCGNEFKGLHELMYNQRSLSTGLGNTKKSIQSGEFFFVPLDAFTESFD